MIKLDQFRLTKCVIDVGSNPTQWFVEGYFITDTDRIFASFSYSTDPRAEAGGYQLFVADEKVRDLTSSIMAELHSTIGKTIWEDYGKATEDKTTDNRKSSK